MWFTHCYLFNEVLNHYSYLYSHSNFIAMLYYLNYNVSLILITLIFFPVLQFSNLCFNALIKIIGKAESHYSKENYKK